MITIHGYLYCSIFGVLWKNGIDASQRIRDIEEGFDLAEIEVIPRSSRARQASPGLSQLALTRGPCSRCTTSGTI
jgi:hypothetical protein